MNMTNLTEKLPCIVSTQQNYTNIYTDYYQLYKPSQSASNTCSPPVVSYVQEIHYPFHTIRVSFHSLEQKQA